jgi:hypothetical protein
VRQRQNRVLPRKEFNCSFSFLFLRFLRALVAAVACHGTRLSLSFRLYVSKYSYCMIREGLGVAVVRAVSFDCGLTADFSLSALSLSGFVLTERSFVACYRRWSRRHFKTMGTKIEDVKQEIRK